MQSFKARLICTTALISICSLPTWGQDTGNALDLGTLALRGELQQPTFRDSPTSANFKTGKGLARAGTSRSSDLTYDQEFELPAEAGSRDHLRFAAMANTPLIQNRMPFCLSAEHLENDGYDDDPTLGVDEYDAREVTTYRAKLLWDANEDEELVLSDTRLESLGGEDLEDEPPFPDARENALNVQAREGSEHDIFGLRISWSINEMLTLESKFAGIHVRNILDEDYAVQRLASTEDTQRLRTGEPLTAGVYVTRTF